MWLLAPLYIHTYFCGGRLRKALRKEITVIGEAAFAVYPTDYFPVTITVRTIRKKH